MAGDHSDGEFDITQFLNMDYLDEETAEEPPVAPGSTAAPQQVLPPPPGTLPSPELAAPVHPPVNQVQPSSPLQLHEAPPMAPSNNPQQVLGESSSSHHGHHDETPMEESSEDEGEDEDEDESSDCRSLLADLIRRGEYELARTLLNSEEYHAAGGGGWQGYRVCAPGRPNCDNCHLAWRATHRNADRVLRIYLHGGPNGMFQHAILIREFASPDGRPPKAENLYIDLSHRSREWARKYVESFLETAIGDGGSLEDLRGNPFPEAASSGVTVLAASGDAYTQLSMEMLSIFSAATISTDTQTPAPPPPANDLPHPQVPISADHTEMAAPPPPVASLQNIPFIPAPPMPAPPRPANFPDIPIGADNEVIVLPPPGHRQHVPMADIRLFEGAPQGDPSSDLRLATVLPMVIIESSQYGMQQPHQQQQRAPAVRNLDQMEEAEIRQYLVDRRLEAERRPSSELKRFCRSKPHFSMTWTRICKLNRKIVRMEKSANRAVGSALVKIRRAVQELVGEIAQLEIVIRRGMQREMEIKAGIAPGKNDDEAGSSGAK